MCLKENQEERLACCKAPSCAATVGEPPELSSASVDSTLGLEPYKKQNGVLKVKGTRTAVDNTLRLEACKQQNRVLLVKGTRAWVDKPLRL